MTNILEGTNHLASDEGWIQRLWDWADVHGVPDAYLPRNRNELLQLKEALPGLWGDSSLGENRVEVQPAEVKQDIRFEPGPVPVPACFLYH